MRRSSTCRLARAARATLLAAALAACSSESYVVVTVEAPPTVHGARALTIGLANGGTTRSDTVPLGDHAFPVTFSVSAPGRTGELGITVDATTDDGLVVGRGSATSSLSAASATVVLDATDFVVNTDFAGDQFPTEDFEAAGFQLAALPDGTWTAVYRDSCMENACNLFGRRFDATGAPVQTQLAASSNAFVLTTSLTSTDTTPAVASSATTTLAAWDFFSASTGEQGVACRALDPAGRALTDQVAIAAEHADVVAIAAQGSGNFVVSWNSFVSVLDPSAVHAAFVKPDCTLAVPGIQLVSSAGDAHRASVAASGDQVLFAWVTDGSLHTRLATSAGTFSSSDTTLVSSADTPDEVAHARVAAAPGGGFVIAVRWTPKSLSGPGRIELLRVDATGNLAGAPTLITDRTALDDMANLDNDRSFALASRADGLVLVAWHTCGDFGDDNLCGVFGRYLRDTGEPASEPFGIPTTTAGDQTLPSVVALPAGFVAMWSDGSSKPPDTLLRSVRARILPPP
ncbi:MAG TPA: hypothetical protein VFK02_28480 [Kofleriaceae bacterium]|nr:hypothetical protein [Kofleriaceae bacterium]